MQTMGGITVEKSNCVFDKYELFHRVSVFFVLFGRIDGSLYENDIVFLLLILLSAFGIFLLIFRQNQLGHTQSYITWQLTMLIIFAASITWAFSPETARIFTIAVAGRLFLLSYLWLYITRTNNINYVVKSFVVVAFIVSIHMFFAVGVNAIVASRITGNPGDISQGWNANALAMNGAVAIFFIQYFLVQNNKFETLILKYGLFAFFSVIILISGSKKGILMILLLLCIPYYMSNRSKIIPTLKILFFVSVAMLIIMNVPFLYEILGSRIESFIIGMFGDESALSTSDRTRTNLIAMAQEMFMERPFLGYGLGNFKAYYGIKLYSHNNYYELLTSVGILGTVVYYQAYLRVFLASIKGRKTLSGILSMTLILVIAVMEWGLVSYTDMLFQFMLIIAMYLCRVGSKDKRCKVIVRCGREV